MRVPVKELFEKLGVGRELHPYETQPWLHYDDEKGITCSAEVRVGPGGDDVEAEIQFLYDDDAEIPEEPEEENKGDKGKKEEDGKDKPPKRPLVVDGRMQVMWMRAIPITEGQWSPKELTIKGKNFVNKMHDWEGKCCNFFVQCIQAMQMGELPDIDALIAKELPDDNKGGGRRGRIGKKSPTIKPETLLGAKKGM